MYVTMSLGYLASVYLCYSICMIGYTNNIGLVQK